MGLGGKATTVGDRGVGGWCWSPFLRGERGYCSSWRV